MMAVIPILTFAARHFLMVAFAIFAGCLVWTIMYVVLLAVAVLGNGGLGGPVAYPAGLIVILGTCIILGWGIFAPASGIGAIFCRVFRLPRLAAIPVVFVCALLLNYLLKWAFIELGTTHPMPPAAEIFKYYLLFLSVPLGTYWWLTEGPGALFDAFRRWLGKRLTAQSESRRGTK